MSISSFQAHSSQNDSEQEEEENPELRFSFQMMSTDPKAVLPDDKLVRVGSSVFVGGFLSQLAIVGVLMYFQKILMR